MTIQESLDNYNETIMPEDRRSYLGGSEIGNDCQRKLWYSLRWADKTKFPNRIKELFEMGNLAEMEMEKTLKLCGIHVFDQQLEIKVFGGHGQLHIDGKVIGVPEDPEMVMLWENKGLKNIRFNAVKKHGCEKKEKIHYLQCQFSMGQLGLEQALYTVRCNNTANKYAEIIKFDQVEYDILLRRMEEVIFSPDPPFRITENEDSFDCKFCDFKDMCHRNKIMDKSCRTCKYVCLANDGSWSCNLETTYEFDALTENEQHTGCDHYLSIINE